MLRIPTRWLAVGAVSLSLLSFARRADAEIVDLQNDGFVDMASVGFQQGFVAGEMGAVTLGPVADPFSLLQVKLLFGPGNNPNQTITLHVYPEDDMGNLGAELFTADAMLMPADNALQLIDLSMLDVQCPAGNIRIAIEFHNAGFPSIARDGDGNITPGKNWIYTQGAWKAAEDLGVTGDWIIRAEVDTMPATSTSSTTGASTSAGSGSSSSASTGTGGGPCTAGATQTCTGTDDCEGTATCKADGSGFDACVCDSEAEGSGCGCVVPSEGAATPWWLVAGAGSFATAVWVRRRRRSRRPSA